MNQKDIEQICIDTILNHRSKYIDVKETWVDLVKRYDFAMRSGSITQSTETKIVTGQAYALVENALPRIVNKNPTFKYLARGRDDAETTDLYEQYKNYQWEETQANAKLKTIVRWGLVCGLAGWKIGWKEEREVVKRRGKEIMGKVITSPTAMNWSEKLNIGRDVKVDEENIKANWTLTPIRPFDLVWNVETEEMRDVRVFGHKQRMTLNKAKLLGYDVSKLDKTINNQLEEYWKRRIEEGSTRSYGQQSVPDHQEIEVYELYTRILDESGVYRYNVVTIATYGNNEIAGENIEAYPIRFEDNPYDKKFIPMGVYRPTKKLAKMYGTGIIEPVKGVLDADEDSLNMALEALWVDVSRPMEYVPQNVIKPDDLEYGSRKLVAVRQLGASVAVMPTPQPKIGEMTTMQQLLEKYKQNVSGVTDFQTGGDQIKGAKTLGEIRIKTEESAQRLKMMVDELDREVLQPLGKYALWMNQQFLADKKEVVYNTVDKKGIVNENKIKFKDIEAIKDVIITGGSTMLEMQEDEIQKWSLILDKAMSYNMWAIQMNQAGNNYGLLDTNEIWTNLFEKGLQIRDVDTYIPSLKEVEEEGVKKKMSDLEVIRKENENPQTARVLPGQVHENHMRLHDAAANAYEAEGDAQRAQALRQHSQDHAAQAGGVQRNPEGQVEQPVQPTQPNQLTPMQ